MGFRKMVMMTLYVRQQRDTDVKNRLLDSGRTQEWDDLKNSIETCILSYVKQISSPGSMHETNTRGWCTGMTLRDGMGRKVGGRGEGGSGWATHVHPWLIHVNAWQKPPQYCKVISLQLK